MKKGMKKIVGTILAGSMIFSLAGCGSAAETAKAAGAAQGTEQPATEEADKETQTEDTGSTGEKIAIRLADQPTNSSLFFTYAQDQGILEKYFPSEQYDVEVGAFENGPAINEAISASQLDVGTLGSLPAITGSANGYGEKLIGVYSSEKLVDIAALFVAPDSDIASVADLKGKTIGCWVGTAFQYQLALFLDTAGLTLDDVDLVNLSSADAITAVANGSAEAGIGFTPAGLQAAKDGSVKLLDAESDRVEPNGLIVASEAFAKAHPTEAQNVLKALQEVFELIDSDQEAYLKFVEEATGSDTATLKQTLDLTTYQVSGLEGDFGDKIQEVFQFAVENSLLENPDLTFADISDNSYATAAGF